MFNVYRFVCFSLFIIAVVKGYELNDEPIIEEEPKHSKHHSKIKANVKESDTTKITGNDELQFNTGIADESSAVNEQRSEEFISHDRTGPIEENVNNNLTNNSILSTDNGDFNETLKVGLTRRFNTADNDESDPNSEAGDEKSKKLKSEERQENDSVNNEEPSTESGQIIDYTPNRRTLSQDVVLDLKARTGSGEADLEQFDDNLSKVISPHRSGHAFPDYLDLDSKPADYKFTGVNHFRPNPAFKKELLSQFYHPNDGRPRIINSPPLNPHHRFSPLFFNSMNSGEMVFPHPNSREGMWGQFNAPRQLGNTVRPNFAYNYPNNQIYNQKDPYFYDRCVGCPQRKLDVNNNYRRSAEANSSKYQTADGRSIDFEPTDSNSYPYVPATVKEDVTIRTHKDLSQEDFESSQASRGYSRTLQADSPKYNHIDQPLRENQDNQISKILMPYIKNQRMLNQRIGLRGLSRFGIGGYINK